MEGPALLPVCRGWSVQERGWEEERTAWDGAGGDINPWPTHTLWMLMLPSPCDCRSFLFPETSHIGSPAETFFYIKPEGTVGTNRSCTLCFWGKGPALWLPEARCTQGGPWQLMFSSSYCLMSVLLKRGKVELGWSWVSTGLGIVE